MVECNNSSINSNSNNYLKEEAEMIYKHDQWRTNERGAIKAIIARFKVPLEERLDLRRKIG